MPDSGIQCLALFPLTPRTFHATTQQIQSR